MLDLSFPFSHQTTFRFLVFPQMTVVICCHLGGQKGSIKNPLVYTIFLSPKMIVSRRTRETHTRDAHARRTRKTHRATDKDQKVCVLVCVLSIRSRDP